MSWKETVTSMTERVLPAELQITELQRRSLDKQDEYNLNREVLSNLPLQMALYFNVIFAPIWFILLLIFLNDNYSTFNDIYQFLAILIIVILTIVEVLRLYCGYEGNLRDKVPELAAFWMLSIFLQYPLQVFVLFNPFIKWHPFQTIAQSVMTILLTLELIFGYVALRTVSSHQVTYYRILKLRSEISVSERERRYKAE